jgi:hypothetical protein
MDGTPPSSEHGAVNHNFELKLVRSQSSFFSNDVAKILAKYFTFVRHFCETSSAR